MNREGSPSGSRGEPAGAVQWLGGASKPHAYRLLRKLGVGGMAEVYLAAKTGEAGFARQVAVKVVREDLFHYGRFRELFAAEVQLASRLTHPNIVAVLDYDCDGQGRPFLVMEYLSGVDLFVALCHPRPLPVAMAVFIAAEILRGLAYAHDLPNDAGIRGVVHRDLSPQNVLLSWEGAVKVADFGIAKALVRSSVSGGFVGKPAYMSPEQVVGERLDGRSDLYSAGIMLWEMLAGRRLFGRERAKETFAEIALGRIPPPSSVRAEVPEQLDRVTSKLLAVNRAERYARAEDALADLKESPCMPRDGAGELMATLAERFHRPPRGSDEISVMADHPEAKGAGDRTPTIRTKTDEPSSLSLPAAVAPSAPARGAEGSPAALPAAPATLSRTARRRILIAVGAAVAIAALFVLLVHGDVQRGSSSASPTPAPSHPALEPPLAVHARPRLSAPTERAVPAAAAPPPGEVVSAAPAKKREAKRPRLPARRGPPEPPSSTSRIVDLRLDGAP